MVLLIIAPSLVAAAVALWLFPRKRRWYWKLLGRTVSGILAFGSGLTWVLFLSGSVMCGRYEFSPVSSTDGKLAAEVREEDCGAVDSFHSSVELWQNRDGFFAHLLGKRGQSTTVFSVGNDPRRIELLWKDNQTLLIRYPSDSRDPTEFSCRSQWKNIQIECLKYTPDYNIPVGSMPPVKRGLW